MAKSQKSDLDLIWDCYIPFFRYFYADYGFRCYLESPVMYVNVLPVRSHPFLTHFDPKIDPNFFPKNTQ